VSTPEERIKELARKSAIGPEAAERLLAAVRTEPATEEARYNPFARWSGERTALAGLAVSAVAIAVSRLGARSDGALDYRTTATSVPFAAAVVDQLIVYPVTALALWAVARAFAREVRPIDILGTVGLARLPFVLSVVPLAIIDLGKPEKADPTLASWVGLAVVGAGWSLFLYMLVLGFRTATGLRGGRLAGAFIGGLLVAETVTKVLIHFAPR
jgi:hypothetical protein